MFREDMNYKQFCQLMQGNDIYCWNKYSLLGQLINDDQDCVTVR